MKILALMIFISASVYCACVNERIVLGSEIKELSKQYDVYVESEDATFKKIKADKLIPIKLYHAQLLPKSNKEHKSLSSDPIARYNQRYVEYYTYPRMVKYLANSASMLSDNGYELSKVGESLGGRDLFYVGPKIFDPNKKTIVMFGRHHGDEGTANWIIEGFLNRYFTTKLNDKFQLLLYPMINPDGAMDMIRYNRNGRDLNRSWDANSGRDEIVSIHGHLKSRLEKLQNVVIALDMHGSFTEDFIYRVDRGFKGDSFYEMQQRFIDELGIYDPWQASNFTLSNGHPGMARIVLISHYQLNAMTHESIRNIPLRNNRNRGKQDLLDQGVAVAQAIENLY